jgi:Ca2+-binding EF-hand superfamily protein
MYVLAEFMGIPRALMKEWIKEIDTDGDGNIQYTEF